MQNPIKSGFLGAKLFSPHSQRSALEKFILSLKILFFVRDSFPLLPLAQAQTAPLKDLSLHLQPRQAWVVVVFLVVVAPPPFSNSQWAKCVTPVGAIGGLLLLSAIGVHLWRSRRGRSKTGDPAAGNPHGGIAAGVPVAGRPQSSGVAEERETERRRSSGESFLEDPSTDWNEPNGWTVELRMPSRACIR